MPRVVRHLTITGRVQGVWYRGWTVETATALGLDGWVRNRRDGSVEALVAGEAAAIDRFIQACHDGPPAARVDGVSVKEAADAPDPGFAQRATV